MSLTSPEELKQSMINFHQLQGTFDYVIHNAGITTAKNKKEFHEVNFQGTKNLVHALLESGMKLEKFLFISSLATFGPGDANSLRPIRVTDEEHPISAYARSKQKAEQFIKSVRGLPSVIFKPTAVLGPRDQDFLKLFKMIARGFEFSIGNSTQLISLIHAKDLARAAIAILELPVTTQTYIISDGMNYSNQELNEAIRKVLHKKTTRIMVPLFLLQLLVKVNEYLIGFSGDLPFLNSEKLKEISAANWSCDSQLIWKELGLRSTYSLQQAIEDTALWYKQHGWLKF
jgi:UDP-glucose 4-epimerase